MNLKTSINIRFDFAKSELFNVYLPTPSHAETMKSLLKGFNKEGMQSHIVVGPYGTGKSLLGTLMSGVASHQIEEKDYKTLINKFNNVDETIYHQLIKAKENQQQLLPVFLNGNEGRFREAVISNVLKTLAKHDISITIPGVVSKIISTVDMWESEFPKTFKNFKKELAEADKDFELWRLEILSYNSEEIDWFKEVFPSLTSGIEFTSYETEDFIGQMKYVLEELDRRNLGMIITYDEFGRFLQGLHSDAINEAMQDLQDIAELSNEENSNLHNILIAHKSLRQYFSHLSKEFQQEFQRIERRYGVYYVDSDKSTFLRLGEQVVSNYKKEYSSEYLSSMKENLRRYSLFKELNTTEVDQLVVKGFYPMHPVTTFLLPELSKVFGQNERTLFTFLESDSSNGLVHHINQAEESVYLPYKLFGYFFQDFEGASEDENTNESIVLFNRLKRKATFDVSEENILKLFTILKVTGSYSKVKPTTDFLNFAMNKNVEVELKELSEKKVVRFNFVQGYWEMYDGSSINLDQAVEEKYAEIRVTTTEVERYVLTLMDNKFYLPRRYNHQKSMTRFAKVNVISGSRLIGDKQSVKNEISEADMLINVVLPEESKGYDSTIEDVKTVNDRLTYFVLDKELTVKSLEHELKTWKACEILLEEESFSNTDPGVLEELEFKIEELKAVLGKRLKALNSLSEELLWVNDGKVFSLNGQIQLEAHLTKLMEEIYPDTPEILNDAFNRRVINRVQKKAAVEVVNRILNNHKEENIGIEGTGPDYLIYATVFKNNNLNIAQPSNIQNSLFKKIREDLLNKISVDECTFYDLISVLEDTPYGLRRPIIPLLITSLLRDKWEHLVFYKNDMFIAGLDGEIIYEMMNNEPKKIYVKYYDFDSTYQELFEHLENVFSDYVHEAMDGKPLFLKVTSALLEWLRNLPKYAQLSEEMSSEINEFKENIRYSEIDPHASLEYLKQKWVDDSQFVESYKAHLENFLEKKASAVVDNIMEQVSCDSFASLLKWSKEQNNFQQKTNPLVRSILKSESEEELVQNLSEEIIGVSFEDWSDTTAQAFDEQVDRYFASLSGNVKEGIQISYGNTVKTVKQVELSPKTKTLYNNVHRILKNGGRTVSNDEIESLIFQLMEDFIE